MRLSRASIPYLWALPLCIWSCTYTHWEVRESMGIPVVRPFAAASVFFLGYFISLVACDRRLVSWHQLGHLVLFAAAAFLGFLGANLESDAQLAYLHVVLVTTGGFLAANFLALVWLFIRGPSRPTTKPPHGST